jgi:hypothetical protein
MRVFLPGVFALLGCVAVLEAGNPPTTNPSALVSQGLTPSALPPSSRPSSRPFDDVFRLTHKDGCIVLTRMKDKPQEVGGIGWMWREITEAANYRCWVTQGRGNIDFSVLDGGTRFDISWSNLIVPSEIYNIERWSAFLLTQTPGHIHVRRTWRTPPGVPDIYFDYDADTLERLLLSHPEMQEQYSLICDLLFYDRFTFSGFVKAQVLEPYKKANPQDLAEVKKHLEGMNAKNWRDREKAEKAVEGLGERGVKCLLRMDIEGLSPQQTLAIQNVLSQPKWPILNRAELIFYRGHPEYLEPR